MLRIESRVARLEERPQNRTVTVLLIEDENFYGNAHLLRRKAARGDGPAAESDSSTTSELDGDACDETA